MKQYLYHGSSLANIQTLETRSKLHNSTQKVVYLTDCIPYALVYIWNEKIYHQKWVTCGIRDHLVFYEEPFPNQLAAFYKGVSGYLYCTCQTAAFKPVSQQESMYYSLENVPVDEVIYIEDVYETLLEYEKEGRFVLQHFNETTAEKQNELTDRIAALIIQENLLEKNNEDTHFFKTYFKAAWQAAQNKKPAS